MIPKLKFNNNVYSKNLEDIDSQILVYIKDTIQPYILRRDNKIFSPVIIGNPEKGVSVTNSVIKRDRNNKIQTPMISIIRGTYSKNNIGVYNMDANKPNHLIYTKDRHLANRRFFRTKDDFDNSDKPEHYNVTVMPEYLTIKYSMTIWCEFKSDINKIEEQVTYHNLAYWNNTNYVTLGAFNPTTTYENDERIIKTTIDMTINTKIVPEAISNLNTKGGRLKPYKFIVNVSTGEDLSEGSNETKYEMYYGKNMTGALPTIEEITNGVIIKQSSCIYNPDTNYNEFSWIAVKNQSNIYTEWDNTTLNKYNKGLINIEGLYNMTNINVINDSYNIYMYNYTTEIKNNIELS